VACLDAESGEVLWRYRTGGPVDSPPTVHEGLALFGCADGWVYCLRFADGALVWRLRAAPEDRRIVVRGRIESVWPVPGSVLVRDGVAYFSAGRHTQINGGLYCYAVNPKDGLVLWKCAPGNSVRDNINDVPISDGEMVHIGQRVHLDPRTGDLNRRGSERPVLFPLWGLLQDVTIPSADSGGMAFHARPWAYTPVRANVEPRGIPWNHPLKGNLLAVSGEGVYGIVEQWAKRPRRKVWEVFGKPGQDSERWATVREDYKRLPKALVVTPDAMLIAATSEDRRTGVLYAYGLHGGDELWSVDLPAAPRWDGMALTADGLFIATQDGHVLRLAGE
jgi:outer membrane protein assembly factor BamB